jgi:thiol-disulfide isomerase/thioredoxin
VVVLFFFGNTCPSCRAVAPEIEKNLKVAFANRKDYVIVGLDQWNGSASSVRVFRDVTDVTFPLLLNAASVGNSFNTTYDRLVVVDKKGKIAHRGSRAATNDVNTVVATVNDLLDDM